MLKVGDFISDQIVEKELWWGKTHWKSEFSEDWLYILWKIYENRTQNVHQETLRRMFVQTRA